MNLSLGLKIGGRGVPYSGITPDLPRISALIRAYSVRRIVPRYKNKLAVNVVRSEGGYPEGINYGNDGNLAISGVAARAFYLSDQVSGLPAVALTQGGVPAGYTYALMPGVWDGVALRKGLFFATTAGSFMRMTADDNETATVFNGSCTFSLWTRLPNGNRNLFSRFGSNGQYSIDLRTSGLVRIRAGGNVYISSGENFIDYANKWSMLTVVIDRTSNTYVFYFNGQPTLLAGELPPVVAGNTPLTLGGSAAPTMVNDFVLYNCALSAQEVSDLYSATAGFYS